MDKIIISNARFMCHVGVFEHEKMSGQEIFIDIELYASTKPAAEGDDLKKSINYVKVHDFIKGIIKRKQLNLIETLAENIAVKLLENFEIEEVMIRIKKPSALSDRNADYAAVEIRRKL